MFSKLQESNHKMSDNGVIAQNKSGQPLPQKPRGNAESFNFGSGLLSLGIGRKEGKAYVIKLSETTTPLLSCGRNFSRNF
jgi:hypothetical protein